METVDVVIFKDGTHQKAKLRGPSSLKEIKLKDFAEFKKFELEYSAFENDLIDQEIENDIEGLDDLEDALTKDYTTMSLDDLRKIHQLEEKNISQLEEESTILRNQLKAICKGQDELIDLIIHEELEKLIAGFSYDPKEVEPIADFILPGGADPDIEYLLSTKKKGFFNRFSDHNVKIKIRVAELQKHRFTLVPINDALFKSRIYTDAIRKKLPSMDKELREVLKDGGGTLKKLLEKWAKEKMTLDQIKERSKQIRQITQFTIKYDQGTFESAAGLLAHSTVPVGEEYHSGNSIIREKLFLDLDMHTVAGLLAFFLPVLKHWKQIIQGYSLELIRQKQRRKPRRPKR